MASASVDVNDGGDDGSVSFPRGGPVYVPDMVSALMKVSDFELSAFNELKSLREEVCFDSLEMYDDEISVEELKIENEENLVNMAFEEAFKVEIPNEREAHISSSHESSHMIPLRSCKNGKLKGKDSRKRKHKNVEDDEREAHISTSHESSHSIPPLRSCKNGKSKKKNSSKRKHNCVEGRAGNMHEATSGIRLSG
ncbi:unnamed protein product [Cuscuta campestris]|uniref:Uncharacterized protein n=1 Tax=Cuscuta campestris TaxID=132261 RepID=A0A484L5N3_9ASTE|nr:unnamed protein product [Cuscuta campestris]